MISQMVVRVVNADGTVTRGVALPAYDPATSSGQTKWSASDLSSRKFPSIGRWEHPELGAMLNPVAYQDGDYLVVEIGVRNFTTVTTGGHTWYNDDPAVLDLPADEGTTTNLRSWIEFSPPTPSYDYLLGSCLAGHTACPWNAESDPVNTATGNYFTTATDLAMPGIVTQAVSGEDIDWGEVAGATAAGAVSGAACTVNIVGCVGVSAGISVGQYQLSSGDKTLEGYLASAVIGGIAGFATRSIPKIPNWSPAMLRETWKAQVNLAGYNALNNLPRSATITALAGWTQSAVALGATAASGVGAVGK